jgi:hypothetical protein
MHYSTKWAQVVWYYSNYLRRWRFQVVSETTLYLHCFFVIFQFTLASVSNILLITVMCNSCFVCYSEWVINIDNCRVSLKQLGNSMKLNGWVESWVINAFYRKFFRDNHPRKSKKHYFFHTCSVRRNFIMFLNFFFIFLFLKQLLW